MNKNLIDITLLVDRSGSMSGRELESEQGIKSLVRDQAKNNVDCKFTLYQFDTEFEKVFDAITPDKDKDVEYKLVPRGMTAYVDALGRSIKETGERLRSMENPRSEHQVCSGCR